MDLFEMLGVSTPEVKKEEEVKKEASTKKGKGNTKKPAKVENTHKSVSLNTGFCIWNPELGEEGKRFSELKELFAKEYPGAVKLYEVGTASQLRVMIPNVYYTHEAKKDEKLPAGLLIAFGSYQLVTEEEMTVCESLNHFGEMFPEFEGCFSYLDEESNVLCPFVKETENEPSVTFPASVGYGDEVLTIEDVPSESDYKNYLIKEYEKKYAVKLQGLHYNDTLKRWIPVFKGGDSASGTASAPSKKEEKYKIPVTVRVPMETLTFDASCFKEGATEVTAEEIRVELAKRYFEYSKERTKLEWDKTHNCMIAILKTSTKGACRSLPIADFEINEEIGKLVGFKYRLP